MGRRREGSSGPHHSGLKEHTCRPSAPPPRYVTFSLYRERSFERYLTRVVSQEGELTRAHFTRCGYDSIQWAAVEVNKNRVWNPERNVRYPLVSEDLWNKHLSSKKNLKMPNSFSQSANVTFKNDGDEVCIRMAQQYATRMDDEALLTRLVECAEEAVRSTGSVAAGDRRFAVIEPK